RYSTLGLRPGAGTRPASIADEQLDSTDGRQRLRRPGGRRRMTAPTVAGAPAQPRPTTASPGLRYLRFIRYRALLLLRATPLCAALFAVAFTIPAITPGTLGTTLVFAVAGFLLLAHTFTFNDWAEFASDLMDPEKAATLVGRDASRPELAILSVGLLALALGLFGLLSGRALALAALLAVLGGLYSHPALHVQLSPLAPWSIRR